MSTEPASYVCTPIPAAMLRPPQPLVPHQPLPQSFRPDFTATERVYLSVAIAIGIAASITAALCIMN